MSLAETVARRFLPPEPPMKNNFAFECQTFAADAILHVSAGVPPEKTRRKRL
jgi:hypothetical protein